MTIDPNWLYSTIAQSSAAIVAIIGGLITTTVLSRRTEKTSLKNQLADKESQLPHIQLIRRDQLSPEEYQEVLKKNVEESRQREQLTSEITSLKDRIQKFQYPPDLGWGLLVLLIMTVFSIIIPTLMIFAEAYSTSTKLLVMVSFIVGLAAVFSYIFFQIKALRK